jgi:hypothetical protein
MENYTHILQTTTLLLMCPLNYQLCQFPSKLPKNVNVPPKANKKTTITIVSIRQIHPYNFFFERLKKKTKIMKIQGVVQT